MKTTKSTVFPTLDNHSIDISLTSAAELYAEPSEYLEAFSGIKLNHIKSQVARILNMIGRNGIFSEYTKHDISHIDKMLKSLDWIIPEETKAIMTPADWLMLVLSIYFHDLGMLVTNEEFEKRSTSSEFLQYEKNVYSGLYGLDYMKKVEALDSEIKPKFLYQEFVRSKHAERIKYWILGRKTDTLGACDKIIGEIDNLLSPLDDKFRKDLALICESHHLDDLNDFTKYKNEYRYGNDDKESVNIHYCAIILRTADLLHITSDRTPSIEFRLINPSDPLSQEEWYKQMAVKAVRPQVKRDENKVPDPLLPKDTIEVTAYFKEANRANGFFGLISYLSYAKKQLQRNCEWVIQAQKTQNSKYSYPWIDIDESNIETEGFEKKLFEFKLDQSRILQLLVGHTLYNDSTVVLRELIQNSIDAVRLQYLIDLKNNTGLDIGNIFVKWDDSERTLTIEDTGTGMTQKIIVEHLLKVGSSRYQSEEFQKTFPEFSPISRFGIGILTCFLIADDIEIITSSSDEEYAKKLSVRNVDGKYLLQHLSKEELKEELRNHGTSIALKVRHDVDMKDIEENIKKWILFPPCTITLEKNEIKKTIGYSQPKVALETYLKDAGYELDSKKIKVVEVDYEGITLAYALRYNDFFREWTFLTGGVNEKNKNSSLYPIGVCIEGVRVEFSSPGFNNRNIISVANATGKSAPSTNVARSNFEMSEGKDSLLEKIYYLYATHVKNEIENLYKEQGFSLTWAAHEASFILGPLINNDEREIQRKPLLMKALGDTSVLLVESELNRESVSPNYVRNLNSIWTVDSHVFKSAESLIKEIPTAKSVSNLVMSLYGNEGLLIDVKDKILCGYSSYNKMHDYALMNKMVDVIRIDHNQRRVDLRWSNVEENSEKKWLEFVVEPMHSRQFGIFGRSTSKIFIQLDDCDLVNITDEIAVKSMKYIFLFKGNELHDYIIKTLKDFNFGNSDDEEVALKRFMNTIALLIELKESNRPNLEKFLEEVFKQETGIVDQPLTPSDFFDKVNKEELFKILTKTKWNIFDPMAWSRDNFPFFYF
ncbi:HD domain-containing protein [Rufibacter quisquiliarum]|uniref:HD-CE domain-containing protein n=1 Tax=Rufibacter quisquiliarum TaxID=1549639 RepID=A0A839GL28_9BACT|nr:ATP-binding protein [Rufibacter quisquiliarum]MBA9079552.1 hypothetical protein [Rufibacter quisquiliarum]